MLESLTTLLQPWADLYAEETTLATGIVAAHLLALFIGGGIAVGADRRVLLAQPGSPEAYLAAGEDLRSTHGIVLIALAIAVLSGLALAAADIGTFSVSVVFWCKMAGFALLLLNGSFMRRTEARVIAAARPIPDRPTSHPDPALPWQALRRSASLSIGGWCITLLLGVVLANS